MIKESDGSGNNWACGYYNFKEKYSYWVVNRAQHLLEKEDTPHRFLFFNSLAGGSGSGLGSYL